MLGFVDNGIESTILNMLKEPKKTMSKELKGSIRTMSHQLENIQ